MHLNLGWKAPQLAVIKNEDYSFCSFLLGQSREKKSANNWSQALVRLQIWTFVVLKVTLFSTLALSLILLQLSIKDNAKILRKNCYIRALLLSPALRLRLSVLINPTRQLLEKLHNLNYYGFVVSCGSPPLIMGAPHFSLVSGTDKACHARVCYCRHPLSSLSCQITRTGRTSAPLGQSMTNVKCPSY